MAQVPPMDLRGALQAIRAGAQDFQVRLNRRAFRYDVLTRGGTRDRPDGIHYSNDVVIAVFPFKHPSLAPNFTSLNAFEAPATDETMAVREPVFLESLLVQAVVSHDKSSPIGQFSGFFKDPQNVLLASINPGDWMAVWFLDNHADAQSIRDRIRRGEPCNGFHDGLKFVGKVGSCRRRVLKTPRGAVVKTVAITGEAFSEFTGEVYFDPWVTIVAPESFMQNFSGGKWFAVLSKTNGAIDINAILPHLVSIFIGSGPPKQLAQVNIDATHNKTVSPNKGYLIPKVIARLLGKTVPDDNKDGASVSQILQCVFGIQSYALDVNHQGVPREARGFIPDLSTEDTNLRARTTKYMSGVFNPQLSPWTGAPIWGILSQFLNPAINEMYTTLRLGPDGRVVPHFVVRQIPFTTNTLRNRTTATAFTEFTSLPRWVIDPMLITSLDVGKSSTQRVNFVQVRAQPIIGGPEDQGIQIAQVNPSGDWADISRSGLRSFITTVNSEIASWVSNQTKADAKQSKGNRNSWYSFLAGDWLIGGHLKYTGTMACRGIQDPICVGDNLEFDDVAYHLERVQHTVAVNAKGEVTFETAMSLSNGVDGQTGLPPEIGPVEGQPQNIVATTPSTNLDPR